VINELLKMIDFSEKIIIESTQNLITQKLVKGPSKNHVDSFLEISDHPSPHPSSWTIVHTKKSFLYGA